jgi:hypothetical protein
LFDECLYVRVLDEVESLAYAGDFKVRVWRSV